MSTKTQKTVQKGFTIIEVLIVLAIAATILLLVFLAVPALQRNSRNTQRKNDVQAALGAVQEAITNSNGQLAGLTVANAIANGKYGYFQTSDFSGSFTNGAAVASVTPTNTGVIINNYSKCPVPVPATGAITTSTNATTRSVTAIYEVETASGYQNQCQDM